VLTVVQIINIINMVGHTHTHDRENAGRALRLILAIVFAFGLRLLAWPGRQLLLVWLVS